jgi:hypothetical protein
MCTLFQARPPVLACARPAHDDGVAPHPSLSSCVTAAREMREPAMPFISVLGFKSLDSGGRQAGSES